MIGSDMQYRPQKKGLQTGEGARPCGWPKKGQGLCCGSVCLSPLLLGDVHGRHEVGGGWEPRRDTVPIRPAAATCVYNLSRGER